ncbi:MAG: MEDS domain-containing protein [bacterium]
MTDPIPSGLPGVTLSEGDHICAFYRGAEGRDEILVPFLRAGVEAGDLCTAVLDQVEPDELAERILDHGGNPEGDHGDMRDDGLSLMRSSEAYLRNGAFDKRAMIDFWDSSLSKGLAGGEHAFARSCGEMSWSLQPLPGVESLVEYESELNRFLPRYPQVILCLYDLDLFDGQVVVDLLRTHPKLLLCGSLLDNPYYLEPEEFLAARSGAPSP